MKTNIIMFSTEVCPECNGKGEVVYSCCTGEPVWNDEMMCPKCCEHLGEEEGQNCNGTGLVDICDITSI